MTTKTEYAIFYNQDKYMRFILDEPVAAVKYQNGVITMTAQQSVLNRWINVFENSRIWPQHTKNDRPLSSYGSRMTFPPYETYIGKQGIDIYNTVIIQLQDDPNTKTIEITPNKQ